jgi:hypothetical protein
VATKRGGSKRSEIAQKKISKLSDVRKCTNATQVKIELIVKCAKQLETAAGGESKAELQETTTADLNRSTSVNRNTGTDKGKRRKARSMTGRQQKTSNE